VLGILAEGSLVRIMDPEGSGGADGAEAGGSGGEVTAAVSGGFLSVSDDQISILAVDAQLGREVDTSAARTALDETGSDDEESTEAKYAKAQLRAAGEQA
jgi:F-type H+-transporting ATPase subunit epsilon